jgi:hypothetical protein
MQFDATTKEHVERRTAEGKSLREIRLCLKKFIARQLFRNSKRSWLGSNYIRRQKSAEQPEVVYTTFSSSILQW